MVTHPSTVHPQCWLTSVMRQQQCSSKRHCSTWGRGGTTWELKNVTGWESNKKVAYNPDGFLVLLTLFFKITQKFLRTTSSFIIVNNVHPFPGIIKIKMYLSLSGTPEHNQLLDESKWVSGSPYFGFQDIFKIPSGHFYFGHCEHYSPFSRVLKTKMD